MKPNACFHLNAPYYLKGNYRILVYLVDEHRENILEK